MLFNILLTIFPGIVWFVLMLFIFRKNIMSFILKISFPKKKSPLEKSVVEAYRRRDKAQSVVDLFNKNKELENNIIRLNAKTEKLYQDMYKEVQEMYEEALNDETGYKHNAN
jgi:hypothetical protein